MAHDRLGDEQILLILEGLDDSDGLSDGEDDLLTYNPHRLLTSDSESESDSSEHAHEDLRDECPSVDEDIAVPSPSFPPLEISTPPPLRRSGRGRRPSRGLTRGRIPSRQTSRGRIAASRGRQLSRGSGVRMRGISARRILPESCDWNGTSFSHKIPDLNQPSYIPRNMMDWEPYDFVKDYMDDALLQVIVTETNRTAVHKTGRSLGLTLRELKVFVGINFIMATLDYPHIRMYWSRKWRVSIIANSMERDRFFKLRTSLKCVFDNDVSEAEKSADKLWKVRPILDRILQGCLKQERSKHICIDEMIIPFSGSCSIRQYVPNKPHPLGLKVLVLANPNGIVCDMFVYQGNTTFTVDLTSTYSLNECCVLKLTESLVPGHVIYYDRYFTSLKLARTLLDRGMHSSGTLMKNRIPKNVILMPDADMKRKGRGTCYTTFSSDGKIALTKWFDNKPVLMLSTCYAADTIDFCRRWSKTKKEYEMVMRPEVIQQYNRNMGGVDLIDRMLAVCPSRARTRKWTIRFIFHMFDLAIANSWLLYRSQAILKGTPAKNIEPLRNYKLILGEQMVEENTVSSEEESGNQSEGEIAPRHKKRKININPIPSSIRRAQRADHMPTMTEKQSRCRNVGCNKKSRTKCIKCDIYLCLTVQRNCYMDFHKK